MAVPSGNDPGSYRGMGIAYDEAARIPMIMHWPEGLPQGVTWGSGVNLVDLAPTILGAAGINTKSRIMEIITGREGSPFHGRDLVAEVRAGADNWPTPVFMQNVPEAAIDNSWYDERAMRSEGWKLVLRDFTADPRARGNALFDMVNDPGENAKSLLPGRIPGTTQAATQPDAGTCDRPAGRTGCQACKQ